MKVVVHKDPKEFKTKTFPFLEEYEAANNLIIGIINYCENGTYKNFHLLHVQNDQGKVLMVAIQTPPYNVLLSYHPSLLEEEGKKTVDFLVQYLKENYKEKFPGVISEKKIGKYFCDKLKESGVITDFSIEMNQGIYKLEKKNLKEPKRKSNKPIKTVIVSEKDKRAVEIVHGSMKALHMENEKPEDLIKRGEYYAGENDEKELVTVLGITRVSANGNCIGYVYTPVKYRKNGFAGWNVYNTCKKKLEKIKFLCLYTDLANDTSNKIYQEIGFKWVCASVEIKF